MLYMYKTGYVLIKLLLGLVHTDPQTGSKMCEWSPIGTRCVWGDVKILWFGTWFFTQVITWCCNPQVMTAHPSTKVLNHPVFLIPICQHFEPKIWSILSFAPAALTICSHGWPWPAPAPYIPAQKKPWTMEQSPKICCYILHIIGLMQCFLNSWSGPI